MSIPINNVKIEKERASQVPVNLSTSFNSGDMMKWDAANNVATPMVSGDAGSAVSAALFIGVSNDTNPIPTLGQNLPVPRIAIITRGIVAFTADDNAVYNPGDAVCIGSDPQKIRHTGQSGSFLIGFVAAENTFPMNAGGTASVGITAVQGVTTILVNLRPAFTQLTSI